MDVESPPYWSSLDMEVVPVAKSSVGFAFDVNRREARWSGRYSGAASFVYGAMMDRSRQDSQMWAPC